MPILSLAVAVLLSSGPSFEGVVHAALVGRGASGTLTTYLAAAGVRTETELTFGSKTLKAVVLVLAQSPEVALVFDSQTGAWRSQPRGADPRSAPNPLKAEHLPREKVAGIDCEHWKLSDGAGLELEYWMGHIPGALSLEPMVLKAAQLPGSVMRAFEENGVRGYPMRSVTRKAGVVEGSFTVEKVESKQLGPEVFQAR